MLRKGQVATEFFIYAGVFTILLIATVSTVYFTQGSENARMEFGLAKETGQSFADAINLAVRGGQGFTYNFEYSKKILGKPYYIDFTGSDLYITWKGQNEEFSYVYSIANYDYSHSLCTCPDKNKNKRLYSDCGENIIQIVNTGSEIEIKQKCYT